MKASNQLTQSHNFTTMLMFLIVLGWTIISNVWFLSQKPDVADHFYLILMDVGMMVWVVFLEVAFHASSKMQLWHQEKPARLPTWLGLLMLSSGMACLYGASPLLKYGVNNPEYRLQVLICVSWLITIIVMYIVNWRGFYRRLRYC